MRRKKWWGSLLLGLGLSGCSGSSNNANQDLAMEVGDLAMAVDDLAMAVDDLATAPADLSMAPDLAMTPAPRHPSYEITSASGQVGGATYQLEFQLGHAVRQDKLSGSTFTVEGNAAVKP